MNNQYIAPSSLPKSVVSSTYGTKTKPDASLIFTSALAPLDSEGKALVGFDVYNQTCRVMDIMKMVLESGGAKIDDIVSMRVLLTDINNWGKCCEAYSKYFKKVPAVALEAVSGFTFGPGQLVEIEATAAI